MIHLSLPLPVDFKPACVPLSPYEALTSLACPPTPAYRMYHARSVRHSNETYFYLPFQTMVPETKDLTLEQISAGASKEVAERDTATALGLAPVAQPGTVDAL